MPAVASENLLAWAAQVFVIASLGALLPLLFRMRHPRSHLVYCHLVLIACLVLPVIQPWQHPLIVVQDEASQQTTSAAATEAAVAVPAAPAPAAAIPWNRVVVWILLAGMAARAGWLAAGLWRISRYRAGAAPLHPLPECIASASRITKADAAFCVSGAVPGPVTFGLLLPIVLLPKSFFTLAEEEQRAIACHELLHVRRKDWFVTILEEFLGVLFWFNPAVWWLLAQTRLAREQWVDSQVVLLTAAREPYIDALLAMAGARPRLDLAPAPLFLRRRHLTHRMYFLLSEVSMSRLRLCSSYVAMTAVLALAGWLVFGSFPLVGQAQVLTAVAPPDQAGITVNPGGSVLRRTAIVYPADARQKRVEGAVFAELSVARTGEVTDARVISGPEELRKGVLQSVLQWRYAPDNVPSGTLLVTVDFRLPPPSIETQRAIVPSAPVRAPGSPSINRTTVLPSPETGFSYGGPSSVAGAPTIVERPGLPAFFQGSLSTIDLSGVPEPERALLGQRLQPFQGQPVSQAMMEQIDQIVREVLPPDTLRGMNYGVAENRIDKTLRVSIYPAGQFAPPDGPVTAGPRLRVGGNVQASKLQYKVAPVYPELARAARIQGVIVLEAVISTTGQVFDLKVVTGHPLLISAAIDAVKQWVYEPTLLNGQPTEVITTVTVNFSFQGQ